MRAPLLALLVLTNLAGARGEDECPNSALPPGFHVEASWGARERLTVEINADGRLLAHSTNSRDLLEGHPRSATTRCLSTSELDSLLEAIDRTAFFDLPADVSVPPFIVDQAFASLTIAFADRRHSVRGSGLEGATTNEAVRLRRIWCVVFSLVGSPLDEALPPCRRETPTHAGHLPTPEVGPLPRRESGGAVRERGGG